MSEEKKPTSDEEAAEQAIDLHRRFFAHLDLIRDKHLRPPPGFAERHPPEPKHDGDE